MPQAFFFKELGWWNLLWSLRGFAWPGAAVALTAAERGADVALAARTQEDLQRQAELVRQKGRQALAVTADLSQPQDCCRVVQQALILEHD